MPPVNPHTPCCATQSRLFLSRSGVPRDHACYAGCVLSWVTSVGSGLQVGLAEAVLSTCIGSRLPRLQRAVRRVRGQQVAVRVVRQADGLLLRHLQGRRGAGGSARVAGGCCRLPSQFCASPRLPSASLRTRHPPASGAPACLPPWRSSTARRPRPGSMPTRRAATGRRPGSRPPSSCPTAGCAPPADKKSGGGCPDWRAHPLEACECSARHMLTQRAPALPRNSAQLPPTARGAARPTCPCSVMRKRVGERVATSSWSTFWGLSATPTTAASAAALGWGGRKTKAQSQVLASHTRTVASDPALMTWGSRVIGEPRQQGCTGRGGPGKRKHQRTCVPSAE